MVFTSYEFILVFLPIVLTIVLGLSALRFRPAAKAALFAASIVFYAWWSVTYTLFLLGILTFNFVVARWLIRSRDSGGSEGGRRIVFVVGLIANIAALVWFKYTAFLVGEITHLFGREVRLDPMLLPLGISFIVFQKIALLADAYGGEIKRFGVLDYGLFVSFFPQLISGPIVHHREVIPQFESPNSLRYSRRVVPVAIMFIVIGAVKKVLIADQLSPHVALAFDSGGHAPAFFGAWMGALAFTLQVYFDFSGYSDLAIGLGLLFGIRLPLNFNSPLKATGPIDYWTRWHISLTRFLTAYIYNPLVVRATRRRMSSGREIMIDGVMSRAAFFSLLLIPTMITMLVAGAWHGAGFQFAVFGLVHGGYLVANHAWRNLRASSGPLEDPTVVTTVICRAAMLAAAVIAIPFFRAGSVHDGWAMVKSMLGAHGFAINAFAHDHEFLFLVGAFFVISQVLPNSYELLREQLDRVTTPLERHPGEQAVGSDAWSWPRVSWKPTIAWAIVTALAAWYVMLRIAKPQEFLYFQF
jgi:D-alanyl-lipoteichoic acid acyltransferase DltB (MBOAT superfamily)